MMTAPTFDAFAWSDENGPRVLEHGTSTRLVAGQSSVPAVEVNLERDAADAATRPGHAVLTASRSFRRSERRSDAPSSPEWIE